MNGSIFMNLALILVLIRCLLLHANECNTYTTLNDGDRKISFYNKNVVKCDSSMIKRWYRFSGNAGSMMPESCVATWRCGTHAPGWLNGQHPTVAHGVVTRGVCYHWRGNCCRWKNSIRVRNCGGFFVYELQKPPGCSMRYCGGNAAPECNSYTTLSDADRRISYNNKNVVKCDNGLAKKWYRFSTAEGNQIPQTCVPTWRCGTHASGWINGQHPMVPQEIVTRDVCYHWTSGCCQWKNSIRIRNCGDFYVYELQRPPVCHLRYCVATGADVCSNANWWSVLDRGNVWALCSDKEYLRGLYRNDPGGNDDGLYRIEEAKCCRAPGIYRDVNMECTNVDWVHQLDKQHVWATCPNGRFLRGIYRSGDHWLHNIENGRCCRPEGYSERWGHCYDHDVLIPFDKKGWSVCNSDYYLVGIYRGGCDKLYCIEKFKCCKMYQQPSCPPGYYSSNGLKPCGACPVGYYQSNPSQRNCVQCPAGKTTLATGKRHASDCLNKCQEAVCSLQSWTAWADAAQPVNGHCASQSRRRIYKKTWRQVIVAASCDTIKKTCPNDITDHREKVIYCPKLAAPQFGYYGPSSCMTQTQRCKTVCTIYCKAGFQRQGTSNQAKRTCQANRQWSSSSSYCKDVTPPSIQCPKDIVVNNDPGKPRARVTLPNPTTSDNSGIAATITISPPNINKIHDFIITADSGTKVTYTAMDHAGLKRSCSFFVKVRDAEKPKVLSCPTNVTLFTSKNPVRVMWTVPTFKDNFDPFPRIESKMNPGLLLNWGIYKNEYAATDKVGNKAFCRFDIEIGPLKCKVYNAPNHGARACNIKTSGVSQELICTVSCQDNAEFVSPPKWDAYMCKSEGNWYGYKNYSFTPVMLPDGRPWSDCAIKSSPSAVAKRVTVYAGSCSPNNQQTQEEIKRKFLEVIKSDPLLKYMLCNSSDQGVDCQLKNIKVYCGKNQRRSLHSPGNHGVIIGFDIDIEDMIPEVIEHSEKAKLHSLASDLNKRAAEINKALKQAAASIIGVSRDDADVQEDEAEVSCPSGGVVVVKQGSGSKIIRSTCVNCGIGTRYKVDSKTCEVCPVGTYQDKEGQKNCKTCPDGTVTLGMGSTDINDCRGICGPGEHSRTGLETCVSCPIGFYQTASRSSSCIKCPKGTTTMDVGANSKDLCKRNM